MVMLLGSVTEGEKHVPLDYRDWKQVGFQTKADFASGSSAKGL
jgi:hypothetical protein